MVDLIGISEKVIIDGKECREFPSQAFIINCVETKRHAPEQYPPL